MARQSAILVNIETAIACVERVFADATDGEETFACNRNIKRIAGAFQRTGAHVALQLPALCEGDVIGPLDRGGGAFFQLARNDALDLEPGRVDIGQIVRGHVHALLQELLRGQTNRE